VTPPSTQRPGLVDTALALLFAAGAQLEMWLAGVDGPAEAKVVAAVLTTVPLAWRSVAPVTVACVTSGGLALAFLLGLPVESSLLPHVAPALAFYSVGARAELGGTALALGVAVGSVSTAVAAVGERATEAAGFAGIALAAVVVGRAVRAMGFEADELEARAKELERERDERAQAAVAEERARIARELHDVIGHSISVMGVQAAGVRRLLPSEREREREALLAVERTGRDAVAEMRRLLDFLRSDEQNGAGDDLPTLRRADDLVADMRRAGLDVDLRVEGDVEDLSPGRALASFRILQEAFTNALKHAPGASVRATLRRTATDVEIEVVDDGSGAPPAGRNVDGHGLVGMRERVTLYGGTLEAGPGDERGFKVTARIPAS
jgi:signal transduction histidine kinase